MEDEYLWVLEERHTKKHANIYTSFDVHQIHLEYIWENVLQTSCKLINDKFTALIIKKILKLSIFYSKL